MNQEGVPEEHRMKATIVIEIDEGPSEGFMNIEVQGNISTAGVIGYLEMAKLQHLQSKHIQGPVVYQAPDDISGLDHPGSDRWTGGDKKDEK